MIEALKRAADGDDKPFGPHEEEAIIALMLDHPEFFSAITRFMTHELFGSGEVQYIAATILEYSGRHGVYPTRGLLLDTIKRNLTVDDPSSDHIIEIAQRPSNPREVPAIKDRLTEWARQKAYGLLYDEETIKKYHRGDFTALEDVFNTARSIQDIGQSSMWFFNELDRLFHEDTIQHFTTGFPMLDASLNDGGPARKEVLVWMAPTGVGKSIMLINDAIYNVLKGHKVLLVTFELSDVKSALRALGALTNRPIDRRRFSIKDDIMGAVNRIRSNGGVGDLVIHEFPPDETSVDGIHALCDLLRRSKGWHPDVICLDYLELMVSRRASDNKDEYIKQKSVATQVRGLAQKENVCIFTATQTNRSGNNSAEKLDVTKISESYGKAMSIDYLVSVAQTPEEYNLQYDDANNPNRRIVRPARARMYIAKNRNGPKDKSVPVEINYDTMLVKEIV